MRVSEAELREVASRAVARHQVTAVQIGVISAGDETTVCLGSDRSPFPLASISKLVTAETLARLAERGAVDLDAHASEYLVDAVGGLKRVTLRHLLSHTSGWSTDPVDQFDTGEDALARAARQADTLEFHSPPGSIWSYSNSGYAVAARIAEAVSSRPFEALATELVLEPAGMRSTSFSGDRGQRPYGGLVSTLGDLLLLARHLSDSGAARATRAVENISPGSHEAACLGWWTRRIGGRDALNHGGRSPSHATLLILLPSERLAIAIAPAGGEIPAALCAHEIASWLLDRVVGIRESLPGPLIECDPSEYAHAYVRGRGEWRFVADGGQLRIIAGSEEWPVSFLARDQIVLGAGPRCGLRGEFLRDSDDRVTWFRFERTGLGWAHGGGRVSKRLPDRDQARR